MNVSPREAESTLADVASTTQRAQRAIVAGHAGSLLILWGFLWMLGFAANHFVRVNEGLIWAPIGCLGGLLSWWIGFRDPRPLLSPEVQRVGQLFLALLAFGGIWAILLHPFNHHHFNAYIASVFMFGYVVMGLWLGRLFLWLGLGVTAGILAGRFLLPGWLDLWIAITGGGTLAAAGVYIRRAWK